MKKKKKRKRQHDSFRKQQFHNMGCNDGEVGKVLNKIEEK
jgi:hypothetical protein